MMLQGHFIDSLLDPIYRDGSSIIYNIWYYLRGITAPTFFTISGLVFTYLLLLAYAKGNDQQRIKKGLYRGFLLIAIGYGLRINLFLWLDGQLNPNFFVVDVLQCIGLSLICLIGLYYLFKRYSYVLSIVLLTLGCLCFLTEPLYRELSIDNIPKFFANYVSKTNGSVFTILPWFGYSAFGAFISTVFFRHAHKNRFKLFTIITFFIVGYGLIYHSSPLLLHLYSFTDITLFKDSANYNYLFTRLGNILILLGVFYSFERFFKKSIIARIGEKTLSIYVIHFIILFGSFSGYGLKYFFYESFNPAEAIIGAILFMMVVCFISFYYARTNHFVYNLVRKVVDKFKN